MSDKARLPGRQDGTSLVEVLVAVAILAIVSAPILGAFMVARITQAESTGRVLAQSIARTRMEAIQQLAYQNFDQVDPAHVPQGPDTTYPNYIVTVTVDDTYIDGTVALKSVTVLVEWTGDRARTLQYQLAGRFQRRL